MAAAQRPTGTVTFVFTAMAGSTKLARKFPDSWPTILARHSALLHAAYIAHQGDIFQVIGDEIDAAFATALDALSAAIAAQQALRAEDWGAVGTIQVRMG